MVLGRLLSRSPRLLEICLDVLEEERQEEKNWEPFSLVCIRNCGHVRGAGQALAAGQASSVRVPFEVFHEECLRDALLRSREQGHELSSRASVQVPPAVPDLPRTE